MAIGTIYLAAPIDQVNSEMNGMQAVVVERAVRELRETTGRALRLQGFCTFDPTTAWSSASGKPVPNVQAINELAVRQADALLAIIPDSVETIGVLVELGIAHEAGKPVAIVGGEKARASWALAGFRHFWTYETHEAAAWLQSRIIARTDEAAYNGDMVETRKETNKARKKATELAARPTVKVRLSGAGALMPKRAYADDAGLDLAVIGDHHIPPGGFKDLPTGVRIELPPGVWGMITGRSSTMRKYGLHVVQGIIDTGYRGELFVGVQNLSTGPISTVAMVHQTRIAQLVLFPNVTREVELEQVEELAPSARGMAGFGSSGA